MKRTLLMIGLILTAITAAFGQAATNHPAVIRIACLGDSLTYQEYPDILGKLLGSGYEVIDYGVPGATVSKKGDTSYWTQGKIEAAQKFGPQIVTILLGTNDARPQNVMHKDTFLDDYKALIAVVRNFPTKPTIYIMTPTPIFGKGLFGVDITLLRQELTPMIVKAAKETGCAVIDLYPLFENKPEMSVDNVHLTVAADTIIAKLMQQVLTGKPAGNSK